MSSGRTGTRRSGRPVASRRADTIAAVETTVEEMDVYSAIVRLLGAERPVHYQDTSSYFKIHLPEKHSWVIARLKMRGKKSSIHVPLPLEQVQPLIPDLPVAAPGVGWTAVSLSATQDIGRLGEVLRLAWDTKRRERPNASSAE